MAKQPLGDVVVLLPGILGSVLQRDGKDVWAPTPGAVARGLWTLGRSVKSLQLTTDPWEVDDLGDGVTAPRLMSGVHLVPGLWSIDVYAGISAMITETFDVVPGETYIEFPYDWRRDNRVAARRLQRLAEEKLHAQRQRNPDAKLILIGHSMGGLVARYFLECLGGRADTAHADHVRHAAPRLAERGRLPRQRLRQEARPAEARRPVDAAALVDVGVPAAADLPVRRRRQRPRARRRGRPAARRPGPRRPPRCTTSTAPSRPARRPTTSATTPSTPSSASPRARSSRAASTATGSCSSSATATTTWAATAPCRGCRRRRSRPTTCSRRTSRCTRRRSTARCSSPRPCRRSCAGILTARPLQAGSAPCRACASRPTTSWRPARACSCGPCRTPAG